MLAGLSGGEGGYPAPVFPVFPLARSISFFVLDSPVRKNACTRPGEPGQWKGQTAPKHIWQLSQSLAGEMAAGTSTSTSMSPRVAAQEQ